DLVVELALDAAQDEGFADPALRTGVGQLDVGGAEPGPYALELVVGRQLVAVEEDQVEVGVEVAVPPGARAGQRAGPARPGGAVRGAQLFGQRHQVPTLLRHWILRCAIHPYVATPRDGRTAPRARRRERAPRRRQPGRRVRDDC